MGEKKSRAVTKHFRSVLQMVNAERAEWEKIEGIGKVLAERIHGEIRRED